jgi:hypothetical protein
MLQTSLTLVECTYVRAHHQPAPVGIIHLHIRTISTYKIGQLHVCNIKIFVRGPPWNLRFSKRCFCRFGYSGIWHFFDWQIMTYFGGHFFLINQVIFLGCLDSERQKLQASPKRLFQNPQVVISHSNWNSTGPRVVSVFLVSWNIYSAFSCTKITDTI